MFRRPYITWSAISSVVLLGLLFALLPARLTAQDDPVPLPTAGFSTSTGEDIAATPEVTPETGGDFSTNPDDTAVEVEPVEVINDDFENGLENWVSNRELRTVLAEDGNSVARLAGGDTLALAQTASLSEFEATVWFDLDSDTTVLDVLFGNNYQLTMNAQGTSLRAIDADAPFASDETAIVAGSWHRLDLSQRGGVVTVRVNDVEALAYTPSATEPVLLIMTPFTLQSAGGTVSVDDVRIVDYRPAQLIILPDTSAIGSTSSLAFEADKVGADLRNLIEAFNSEEAARVQELGTSYSLTLDRQGRITVEIWGAEGVSGETLADMMLAYQGRVETVDFKRIVVRLDLEDIAALSLSDQVSVITSVPRLTAAGDAVQTASFSTTEGLEALPQTVANAVAQVTDTVALQPETRSPVGSAITNGYDITGVQSWHNAGFQGNNIRIALFDVGFGSPSDAANGDTVCAADGGLNLSFGTRVAGDARRGLSMLQVICDIAPESSVRLYKAQTGDQLYDAMAKAATEGNRLFVIGQDFGPNFSPGDGTLGYASAKNPYGVLLNARNAGIVVLAAAGNSRNAYTAFNYTGAATTATFSVEPGAAVNIGWNDWDAAPNGAAPREDFSATVTGAGFSTLTKPARGAGLPGYQFIVPTSCTPTAGLCTINVNLTGLTGSASVVQIQASGTSSSITNLTGSTAFTAFGTINRPGDSPNAITVGAVCAAPRLNYPVMNYSSRGPIYTAGGGVSVAPPPPYYTGVQVKPDLVAPAQVSTTFSPVNNPESCGQGFGGTQAGLAHVAGQVAVLLSNPVNPSFQTAAVYDSILRYLRSHSFDQPGAPTLVGYDMVHGAGVPVLGLSNFSQDGLPAIGSITFPNRIPPGACTTGTVYAGPYNVGAANMDGSISRPYNSIMQAMNVAATQGTNSCVIALPGEYSSPIYATGLANKVSVYAYSGVVNTLVQASRLHVQNGHTKIINGSFHSGALFVDATSLSWSSFTITKGAFFSNAQLSEPAALVVNAATDVDFSSNTLQGLTSRQVYNLVEVLNGSSNVAIASNSFLNNVPQFTLVTDPNTGQQFPQYLGTMNLIVVEDSGTSTAGQRITIANNRFQGNKNSSGLWLLEGLPPDGEGQTSKAMNWVSLVRSVDSFTDVMSNTFQSNEAETLLSGVTRLKLGAQEMRVLGNAIVNNTMRSYDGFTSGPIVHYYFNQRAMIVNNTFARNNASASTEYSMIVGRGDDVPLNYFEDTNNNNSGSLGTDARWEFHNNFVVDNVTDIVDTGTGQIVSTDPAVGQVINDLDAPGVGCTNFAGTANAGAFNNWLWRSAQTFGTCGSAFAANGNMTTYDPYPRTLQYAPIPNAVTYIIGGAPAARFNPAYYALVGASNGSNPDGIDDGADAFVVNNLPEFADGLDARGVNRRNNGDNDPAIAIDRGAYEYTPLQLVANLSASTNEDTGVISFVLDDTYLSGGFPPYTINYLRFPKYYGVSGVDGALCDARFTAAARGVVSGALPDGTPVLLYCPPKDFHTSITDPSFQLTNVGFDFRVVDSGNRSANSTMQYTIAPVNDAPLTTVLGNSAPAGDILDAPVAVGRSAGQNFFRLRPYVDFSNGFFFSERNNSVEPTARSQVDYMFTYGTPTLVSDAGNDDPQIVTNNLVLLDGIRGVYGVNLSAVPSIPGGYAQAKLRYSVTDRNGNSVNNIVTVRVLTPPTGFTLSFPGNNSVFLSKDEVGTFRWTEAGNTQNYRFTLSKVTGSGEQVLINLAGLTPPAGDDGLSCSGGTCTLTLTAGQKSVLSTGQFKWTAVANNQGLTTTATNAPFFFNIATGTELVQNGSFELASSDKKVADGWKPKDTDNDKRLCNKPEKGKIFAFAGQCAYRFKGKSGVNSSIGQKLPQFGKANDRLVFSFYARGDEISDGAASAFIKVKYVDNNKAKVPISILPGTSGYTPYAEAVDLTAAAKNAKIKFKMDGGKGKFYIDVVSALLFAR